MAISATEVSLQELFKTALQGVRPATYYRVRNVQTRECRNHFLELHGQLDEHDYIEYAVWQVSSRWSVTVDVDRLHRGFGVGLSTGLIPITPPFWYIGITGQFIAEGTGKYLEVSSVTQLGERMASFVNQVYDTFNEQRA